MQACRGVHEGESIPLKAIVRFDSLLRLQCVGSVPPHIAQA